MGKGCVFCAGTGEVLPPPVAGMRGARVYRKGEERLGSEFITSLHKRRMGNRLDSET